MTTITSQTFVVALANISIYYVFISWSEMAKFPNKKGDSYFSRQKLHLNWRYIPILGLAKKINSKSYPQVLIIEWLNKRMYLILQLGILISSILQKIYEQNNI